MSWSDVAAIVGAGAWAPHIWRLCQRRKVSVIPGGNVELGFTGLGPVVMVTMAFRTQNRDALVDGVRLTMRHDDGQCADFECKMLIETPGETFSTVGDASGHQLHQRRQFVVAIVLTPTAVAERRAWCQKAGLQARIDSVTEDYLKLVRASHPADSAAIAAVVASTQGQAIRELADREFFWNAGEYTVDVAASVAELRRPVRARFKFAIDQTVQSILRGNLAGIDWELRRLAGEPDFQGKNYNWQWPATPVKRI